LWEIEDGPVLRHRCHAGHAYDANLLLAEQSELIDRALWSALRVHEERAALLRRHAEHARARRTAVTSWQPSTTSTCTASASS
jgi:two-component system chemotaxis response regulator CheB